MPQAPHANSVNDAGYFFGFDDLMTVLVEPRHVKLYLAGTHNWELAAAEARNLHATFARISQAYPIYLGLGVAEATTTIFEPKLKAVDAAIAAANAEQFMTAYAGMTAACNACHVCMEASLRDNQGP